MRARRRGPGFGDALTFGGRVPAGVGAILAAMLLASVWAWMERGVASLLALAPAYVLAGEVWRLATWPFVQDGPLTLVFAGMMLWWLGRDLSGEWGERTFLWRFAGLTVLSGAVTTLVAMAWPAADVRHVGAWPIALALLFAWGLMHPGAEVRWFGVVPMTGKVIAQVTVAGTLLWGVAEGGLAGVGRFVPHLSAILVAWVQLQTGGGTRRTWLRTKRRWEAWRHERRARHLRVVDRDAARRDGKDGKGGWMN